jgi:hypothetical protein
MLKRGTALTIGAMLIVAAACGSDKTTSPPVSKIVNLTASLSPANEPSVTGNPTGTGTFTATLDTSTHLFTWNVTFTGLTANASLGHIHGPFTAGSTGSAGVILNFDPAVSTGGTFSNVTFTGLKSATSGSATGSVVLNNALSLTSTIKGDSLEKLLLAGAAYVNIHTATNPGGEIRGQITKK